MGTQGLTNALGEGFGFFGWMTVIGFLVLLGFSWDWLFADTQTIRAALSLLLLVSCLALLSFFASISTGYAWIRWLGFLMVAVSITAPMVWLARIR